MKLRRFDATQVVPVPLDRAWSFFSDAANLPRITPPWLDFRLESALPERAHAGMIAAYRVRVFGRGAQLHPGDDARYPGIDGIRCSCARHPSESISPDHPTSPPTRP